MEDVHVKSNKRVFMANAAFNKTKTPLTNKLDVLVKRTLIKCCIWCIALYRADRHFGM